MHMKAIYAAAATAAVLIVSGAHAQIAPSATPPMATIAPPAAGSSMLRTGTPLPLKMAEALTTKEKAVKVGQRVRLEVAENVLVNGQIVIPAGSPAMGEVTDVRNKGMWGKSGKINARVLYVTVNGRQIRASGQFDDKGTTGTGGVVASVALVPLAGFFVTGTSANIPLGAPVNGFVDEDVPLTFAAASPAPMVVGTPAPTAQPLPAATAAVATTTSK